MTEVTQIDRDVGATLIAGEYRWDVKYGRADEDHIPRAFARHRENERDRIVGIIKARLDTHRGFVEGALGAGVEPAPSIYTAMSELSALLRELEG